MTDEGILKIANSHNAVHTMRFNETPIINNSKDNLLQLIACYIRKFAIFREITGNYLKKY